MFLKILFTFLSSYFCSISIGYAQSTLTSKAFPMVRGNKWSETNQVYQSSYYQFGSTVNNIANDGSRTISLLLNRSFGLPFAAHLSLDSNGLRLHKINADKYDDYKSGSSTSAQVVFNPPLKIVDENLVAGAILKSNGLAKLHLAHFPSVDWTYEITTTVGSIQSITVGTSNQDAIPINIKTKLVGSLKTHLNEKNIWVVPDVGIVKTENLVTPTYYPAKTKLFQATIASDVNCLFSWAEHRYSQFFPTSSSTLSGWFNRDELDIRSYTGTDAYLISNRTQDKFYAQILSIGMPLTEIGTTSGMAKNARSTGCR